MPGWTGHYRNGPERKSRLEVEIRASDRRTRQVYGAEKLQHDLAAHGIRVGICRIKSGMPPQRIPLLKLEPPIV